MGNSKTKPGEGSWQEIFMLIGGILAFGAFKNPAVLKWYLILWSDKMFLVVAAFIIYCIYKYVDREICEHAEEIHQAALSLELREPQQWGSLPTSETFQEYIPDEILVGKSVATGSDIYLCDKFRKGHVQIVGATGRGKTESVIIPWMARDVERGHSVILIDGKGDAELARRFKGKFPSTVVFDPNSQKSATLNPLEWGTAGQITDRIMSSFEFGEEYYKNVQAAELLLIVKCLLKKGPVTFRGIYRALTQKEYFLEIATTAGDPELLAAAREALSIGDKRRDLLSGLIAKLTPFATGEFAILVNGRENEGPHISLSELLLEKKNGHAVLVLLPTLMYPEMAKVLGRMLLQEVAFSVGTRSSREKESHFISVFLDEFSSFAYLGFEQILNKARSANVALHISHQSMGDLESLSPAFAKTVNTNTNIKCLLGLNDPETADFFAAHIGTMKDEKQTERVSETSNVLLFSKEQKRTGEKSVREVERFKFHPNLLKGLPPGQGVLCAPTVGGSFADLINFERISEGTV